MSDKVFNSILDKDLNRNSEVVNIQYKIAPSYEESEGCDVHPKQYELIMLKHNQNKPREEQDLWSCCHAGRGAGKTVGVAKLIVRIALNGKLGIVGVGAMEKEIAIDRFYDEIKKELERVGVTPTIDKKNKGEIQLPTKHKTQILFYGARDVREIEKPRGKRYKMWIWEECQSINRNLIKYINREVIEPAFIGADGFGLALGTPPKICRGWWYDLIIDSMKRGVNYHFINRDNYFFSPEEILIKEKQLKRDHGVVDEETSAFWQREYRGMPMKDTENTVFNYRQEVNDFKEIKIPENEREYLLSVDLGYHDATAIALMCYSLNSPDVYLVYEDIEKRQNLQKTADKIIDYVNSYDITEPIIMDTGGLGKSIQEDFIDRYGLDIIPAEKTQKGVHIELMSDALTTGRLKVKVETQCVSEMDEVEWDEERRNFSKNSIHSDILDAILYGYRYCMNYILKEDEDLDLETLEEKDKARLRGINSGGYQNYEDELFNKAYKDL